MSRARKVFWPPPFLPHGLYALMIRSSQYFFFPFFAPFFWLFPFEPGHILRFPSQHSRDGIEHHRPGESNCELQFTDKYRSIFSSILRPKTKTRKQENGDLRRVSNIQCNHNHDQDFIPLHPGLKVWTFQGHWQTSCHIPSTNLREVCKKPGEHTSAP